MQNFMEEALSQAQCAMEVGEPPIGAVIVKDGEVIARAHNMRETNNNALHHAELLAIDEACKKLNSWRLVGCSMYVTLEPCVMCMGAIINARIDNVYFGAFDKKAGSAGTVLNLCDYPLNHKPKIYGGIMESRCGELLTSFFKALRE